MLHKIRKGLAGVVLAGLLFAGCSTFPQSMVKKDTEEEVTALQNAQGISIGYNEFQLLERDGRNYKFEITYGENSGIDYVKLVGYYGKSSEGKKEYVPLKQTNAEYSSNPEIKAMGNIVGMVPLISGVIPHVKEFFLIDLNKTMYKVKIGNRIEGNEHKVSLESYFNYAPIE